MPSLLTPIISLVVWGSGVFGNPLELINITESCYPHGYCLLWGNSLKTAKRHTGRQSRRSPITRNPSCPLLCSQGQCYLLLAMMWQCTWDMANQGSSLEPLLTRGFIWLIPYSPNDRHVLSPSRGWNLVSSSSIDGNWNTLAQSPIKNNIVNLSSEQSP